MEYITIHKHADVDYPHWYLAPEEALNPCFVKEGKVFILKKKEELCVAVNEWMDVLRRKYGLPGLCLYMALVVPGGDPALADGGLPVSFFQKKLPWLEIANGNTTGSGCMIRRRRR